VERSAGPGQALFEARRVGFSIKFRSGTSSRFRQCSFVAVQRYSPEKISTFREVCVVFPRFCEEFKRVPSTLGKDLSGKPGEFGRPGG
jgi:hypothetical protein